MMTVVPGLLSKVWLRGPEDDAYGGLYLWKDRAACQAFLSSELWGEVVKDDSTLDLASHDFAVMTELTHLTSPQITLV